MPIDHGDIEMELPNAQEAFRHGGQTPEEIDEWENIAQQQR